MPLYVDVLPEPLHGGFGAWKEVRIIVLTAVGEKVLRFVSETTGPSCVEAMDFHLAKEARRIEDDGGRANACPMSGTIMLAANKYT